VSSKRILYSDILHGTTTRNESGNTNGIRYFCQTILSISKTRRQKESVHFTISFAVRKQRTANGQAGLSDARFVFLSSSASSAHRPYRPPSTKSLRAIQTASISYVNRHINCSVSPDLGKFSLCQSISAAYNAFFTCCASFTPWWLTQAEVR
jgi:hypothetical protein